MASQASAPAGLSIDVLNDLKSASDLKNLLSPNSNVLFRVESEITKFLGSPISTATGSYSVIPSLTASPSWAAGPVTFSITPHAKCTVTVSAQGEDFEAALDISDPAATKNVQLPGAVATTYINIDLDFSLAAAASGSGTAEGITISGKAAGSAETTLSFCQPVPSSTTTEDALKLAFSNVVLPTSPSGSLNNMVVGSSTRMTFDGTLCWELDVSYGLADYKLSAASLGLLQGSVTAAGHTLTPPTVELQAGVTASVKYTHTDHFGLIITKPAASSANVYLVRARASESDANIGISAGIKVAPVSVSVDGAGIATAVQSVTKSSALASSVAGAVSSKMGDFESSLLSNLNTKMTALSGDAGIGVALANKTNRVALFNYQVDLTQPAIPQNWNDLLNSNIKDAKHIGGFTLLPGSGIAKQLSKVTKLQLHFFNLFKYSSSSTFFDDCAAALTPDGSIRITTDVGKEYLVAENASKAGVKIHFAAVATEGASWSLSNQSVDLVIEFAETGNAQAAEVRGGVLTLIDRPSLLNSTISAMKAYRSAHPGGSIAFVATLKGSAYGQLSFSPYTNGINKGGPQADQSADRDNWNAIHSAAVTLLGNGNQVVTPWTFDDWSAFNLYSNGAGPNDPPDRRHIGNTNNVPAWFFKNNLQGQDIYFLTATARGMNLFEDIVTLATDVKSATTPDQWSVIEADLATVVNSDLSQGYGQAIAASVLTQAMKAKAGLTVQTIQSANNSTFTMNLVLS